MSLLAKAIGSSVSSNPQPGVAPGPPPRPSRICLIAHPAWGEMSGGRAGDIGGIQRQLSMTARWLAARGHEVSLLVWDEGQPAEVMVDGVRVLKMCRRDEGLPGLRFLHPRWTSLLAAMRKADADVYYQNTAEYVTGQAAFWCRRNGRGFVFSVANDWDVEPEIVAGRKFRDRALYLYGLKHADAVIAQTKKQQRILREAHGVSATVIPMPSIPTGDGSPAIVPDRERLRVVWVARIAPAKRLEMLLDLAELAPDILFEVAGSADPAGPYSDELIRRASTLSNVRMLGRVERERIPDLYRGAACLCCTSYHEGFPNTFLEAWSQGIPVVSTFDPDDLIAEQGLGGVAQDAAGLLAAIRRLTGSPQEWRGASERGRAYYETNHLPENTLPRFEAVLAGAGNRSEHGVTAGARRPPGPEPTRL